MTLTMAVHNRGGNVFLKIVPVQVLTERRDEIRYTTARRAYELFEARGLVHGRDVDDWLLAESEILHSYRYDLKDSGQVVLLHAELPGHFPADQLKISVEARRVMVSGERDAEVWQEDLRKETRRIFRVHDLPVDVNPFRTTAVLKGEVLEVTMPKVGAPASPREKAKAASRGE